MSAVTAKQPLGTPVWIDLGITDLERAMDFYGAVFGWTFDVGPEDMGRYTMCLLDGKPVAAIAPTADPGATAFWWNVYLATDDCDQTVARAVDAGGAVLEAASDMPGFGRMAVLRDPVGAQFSLWQAHDFVGAALVNEPGALLRNDLVTPAPEEARTFYGEVFDFTHDGNPDLAGEFTFLRRPDGHEIGGIVGDPKASASAWGTLFQVADADAAVAAARAAGGTADEPTDMVYGRLAEITDPFGTPFSVGAPLSGAG